MLPFLENHQVARLVGATPVEGRSGVRDRIELLASGRAIKGPSPAGRATAQVRAVLRYCGVGVGVGVGAGVSGGVGAPLNQPTYAITSNIRIRPITPYQRRLSLKSIGPPPDAEIVRGPAQGRVTLKSLLSA